MTDSDEPGIPVLSNRSQLKRTKVEWDKVGEILTRGFGLQSLRADAEIEGTKARIRKCDGDAPTMGLLHIDPFQIAADLAERAGVVRSSDGMTRAWWAYIDEVFHLTGPDRPRRAPHFAEAKAEQGA